MGNSNQNLKSKNDKNIKKPKTLVEGFGESNTDNLAVLVDITDSEVPPRSEYGCKLGSASKHERIPAN